MFVLLLFILAVVAASGSAKEGPIVQTPLGSVEGFEKVSVNGRSFLAFEGVPYATPPVGEYRFKDPIPVKAWRGTWKARTMFKCMQYDHFSPPEKKVFGDEDCLYVNIYTPKQTTSKKLDVLVYIHGGAFMFNYGGLYGPEIIMDRDIIYVNLNYRLGPLGFMSTEDDIVPGNMGLKDQQLALRWIKENIEYFGGNPESITISGMSAGGASVEFHYLAEKSKGLFHRGISMSGCTLNSWVLMEKGLEKVKKLASTVGCPLDNNEQIVDCLRKKPARQITLAVKEFQPWLYNPFSPFGAVVDTWAKQPFIAQHPYNLLKTKKVYDVPWITSYVSEEGLYPGGDLYADDRMTYLDKNWNKVLPYILHYNDVVEPQLMDEVSEKIRKEYLGSEKVSKATFSRLIKALSDRLFVADIEKSGKLHSTAVKSPIYSYYFEYRGAHSKSDVMTGTSTDVGVCHSDDTNYVLMSGTDTLSTDADKKMSKLMVDMFVSFMAEGKPNITASWKPLSKNLDDPWIQLSIKSPDVLVLEKKNDIGNRAFWDTLPLKENERLLGFHDEL